MCVQKLELKSVYDTKMTVKKGCSDYDKTRGTPIADFQGLLSNDCFLPREEVIKLRDWLNQFLFETNERYTILESFPEWLVRDNCEARSVGRFDLKADAQKYCDYLNKKCKG